MRSSSPGQAASTTFGRRATSSTRPRCRRPPSPRPASPTSARRSISCASWRSSRSPSPCWSRWGSGSGCGAGSRAGRALTRWLLALAFAVATPLALGAAAAAHANYVRSNPASDARLVKPPAEVRIEFSEPPDPKGSEIQVLDTAGKRYDRNDVAPSGDPNGLKVSLDPIGDGGYIVAWTATSAVDGHTTKGNFAFVIGSGPLPPVPDVADAVPAPRPLEIAGRALSYAGIALGLGTAFFVLFVHMAAETDETRREAWLLRLAGALVLVGSLALIADQAAKLPPRLGGLLGIRAFAGILLAALSVAPRLARVRPVAALAGGGVLAIGPLAVDRPRRLIALAAGLSAALSATLVSHATAQGNLRDMALDFLHITAVSVWTGGGVAPLPPLPLPPPRQ